MLFTTKHFRIRSILPDTLQVNVSPSPAFAVRGVSEYLVDVSLSPAFAGWDFLIPINIIHNTIEPAQ